MSLGFLEQINNAQVAISKSLPLQAGYPVADATNAMDAANSGRDDTRWLRRNILTNTTIEKLSLTH